MQKFLRLAFFHHSRELNIVNPIWAIVTKSVISDKNSFKAQSKFAGYNYRVKRNLLFLHLFFGFTQVIHIFAVTFCLAMILSSTGKGEAKPQGPTGKHNNTKCNHITIPRITANSPGYTPTSTRKTCIEKIIPITICNKMYNVALCKKQNGCSGVPKMITVTYRTCCRGNHTTSVALPGGCS